MELKTVVEVKAARVAIIEDDGGTTVSITIPSESHDWGSTLDEAAKVPALEARVEELVAERDALLLKVQGYDNDRHTEKQRADENLEWAERTEAHLKTRTRERDEAREKLADVRAFLADPTRPHAARVSNALTALG